MIGNLSKSSTKNLPAGVAAVPGMKATLTLMYHVPAVKWHFSMTKLHASHVLQVAFAGTHASGPPARFLVGEFTP